MGLRTRWVNVESDLDGGRAGPGVRRCVCLHVDMLEHSGGLFSHGQTVYTKTKTKAFEGFKVCAFRVSFSSALSSRLTGRCSRRRRHHHVHCRSPRFSLLLQIQRHTVANLGRLPPTILSHSLSFSSACFDPSKGAPSTAAMGQDADGNLLLTSVDGADVFLNGVPVVTPSTHQAPPPLCVKLETNISALFTQPPPI